MVVLVPDDDEGAAELVEGDRARETSHSSEAMGADSKGAPAGRLAEKFENNTNSSEFVDEIAGCVTMYCGVFSIFYEIVKKFCFEF